MPRIKKMVWYWESIHFKRALGDRVLSIALSDTLGNPDSRGPVEMRIESWNIERHLKRWHDYQRENSEMHPDEINTIKLWHEQWKRQTPKTRDHACRFAPR